MADDVTLPGTGAVVATDEVSSRHFQLVKAAYGADGSATLVAANTGLPVQTDWTTLSGSASTISDLVSADVGGYRWITVQISGTWNAQIQFQCSNDNTTWYEVNLRQVTTLITSAPTYSISSNGLWAGPVVARYFRVRMTSVISGSASATVFLSAAPGLHPVPSFRLESAGSVTLGVSGSSTPADSATFANSVSTMAAAAAFNGSSWDRVRSFGTTGALGVTPVAGTSGGWLVSSQTALTNTAVAVKGSAGQFGGYMIYNPNTSVAHVQVWNVAAGSVTVGTTAPTYVLSIPAASAANLELTCGVAHSTAIAVAATTTPTGSTAPTSALVAAIFYK
jgi:hypothetical protein